MLVQQMERSALAHGEAEASLSQRIHGQGLVDFPQELLESLARGS